jgi:23S rRNA (adenine2503-C2)-methyltransferase
MNSQAKIPLCGLPPGDLETLLTPLPKYRAKQIFEWVNKGAASFEQMSNLPLTLRAELDERFSLRKSSVIKKFEDEGGAVKLQIAVEGGIIESVILTDGADRHTACVSTQLGCPAGCVFCKTGAIGFSRNLDHAEIAEQYFHIRETRPDIANIVIMGMGEPLLNLDELTKAISSLCASLSPRRITVSTSGIIAGIVRLADKGPPVRLAVSVTTADEKLRQHLMPISAANPLPELKKALRYHQQKHNRRLTLEAVLLSGINTRPEDAASMAAFAKDLDVIINLIPWNPVENLCLDGTPLKEPGHTEVEHFRAQLENHNLKTALRLKKGRGINGACGQLGLVR